MQQAFCSKQGEDTCAVCTNNARMLILLCRFSGSAATLRPMPQRSGRFFSDCRSPLPLFPNQYLLDLCIGRAINIAPLDFSFRRACLDVPAFPPVILAFVNVFSPSCCFYFLLRLGHPSDHLFCPPTFSTGFFMQDWEICKKFQFLRFFSEVMWDTFVKISIEFQI